VAGSGRGGGALDHDRRVGDSIEEVEGREAHRGGFMTAAVVGRWGAAGDRPITRLLALAQKP
jgi:hypothetical protein